MSRKIYQKFLLELSLLGLVASLLAGFYEDIFGTVFEFCHLVMEVIEMGLDRFIEHTFHIEKRETELIVFYILLVVGGFLIYFTWKLLVVLCASLKQILRDDWFEFKEALSADWEVTSITQKIFWLCAFLLINYLVSFFFF